MNTLTSVHVETSGDVFKRLNALYRYRELMWMLAWRDIRVRYKHSALGAAWAVMPPLLMMLVFTFVFGTVIGIDSARLTGDTVLPYSLFAFSGLVPWMFFANGMSGAIGSLVSNRALVTKIYFPREVFPLAAIGSAVVDFLIALTVLGGLTLYMHVANNGWSYQLHGTVAYLPLVIVVQLTFMAGLGLALSMANLYYRDVGFLFRSVIQLWMFVTCVVYQLEATTGWKAVLIQLNPMTPIIQAYRDCLILGRSPLGLSFFSAAVVSVVLLLVSWWWFRRKEFDFAENI